MRLATEYYALNSSEQDFPHKEKLGDKALYHYAIFSDNVLATTVVVNSTIFHAKVDSSILEIYTTSEGNLLVLFEG